MSANPKRPYVILNVAMSADGKISSYRRESPFTLGSKTDRYLMDTLRARSDAVIMGAETLRRDGWAILVRDAELSRKRSLRLGAPHPLNVVLTSRLDFKTSAQFFSHPDTQRLVVTGSDVQTSRIEKFKRVADVVVVGAARVRPRHAMQALKRRGIRRVLLEGGGTLNFAFLSERLVDEIFLTITPRIIGGATAPTPVDGAGFLEKTQRKLELVSCRRREQEVFLRYRVVR